MILATTIVYFFDYIMTTYPAVVSNPTKKKIKASEAPVFEALKICSIQACVLVTTHSNSYAVISSLAYDTNSRVSGLTFSKIFYFLKLFSYFSQQSSTLSIWTMVCNTTKYFPGSRASSSYNHDWHANTIRPRIDAGDDIEDESNNERNLNVF